MKHNFIESINYQEGSVVSKTIIDKPTGTVTLFAFDKDQGLSPHTAPYEAILHVLEGSAEITIAEEVFDLEAGDYIILPVSKTHAVKAKTQFKMILTMIKG